MAEKKKSGFGGKLLLLLALAVVGYAVGAVSYYFTADTQNLTEALTSNYAWIGLAVGVIAGLLFIFYEVEQKACRGNKG